MANASILHRIGQALGGVSLCLIGSWLLVVCGGGLLILGIASLFYVGVFFSLGLLGVGLLMTGACLILSALNSSTRINKLEDKTDWFLSDEMTKQREKTLLSSPLTSSAKCNKNVNRTSIQKSTSLNPFD